MIQEFFRHDSLRRGGIDKNTIASRSIAGRPGNLTLFAEIIFIPSSSP
jgi:hypothetical protein